MRIELVRSKLRGIRLIEIAYPGLPSRYPRMSLAGVQFEHPAGFPLKECGNDGLRKSCGNLPRRLNTSVAAFIESCPNVSKPQPPARKFCSH
jgi:hypothetical protein